MFINPVRMNDNKDKLKPDNQPIGKVQARSAILLAPQALARPLSFALFGRPEIEWDYVEIHASHFVAEGLRRGSENS